ncbi:hypothetical protein [Nonomuraea sp. NPDC023979]|uniref:hypothetical protein n=1 Tax=Nonomuraea sp. NPDC023979 TaxID=3154796 RepID=UPI003400C1D7
MRHDDHHDIPPGLPDGRPYRDYDGPLGFADAGQGGYPVERDDVPARADGEQDEPAGTGPGAASTGRTTGRRLHNPLPPITSVDDEDWYEPDPVRTDWRKLAPIALTLAAAIALGLWLALAPNTRQTADPGPPSPTRHQPPDSREFTATTRTTPPARTSRPTTSRSLTTAPSTTPRPTRTPSARPSPTGARTTPPPSTRPIVTVTETVTVTTRTTAPPQAQRTPRPSSARPGGPEEPPGSKPSASGPRPTTTCRMWADCHDGPPEG